MVSGSALVGFPFEYGNLHIPTGSNYPFLYSWYTINIMNNLLVTRDNWGKNGIKQIEILYPLIDL